VLDRAVQGLRLGPPDAVDVEPADFEVPGNGVAAACLADGWTPVPIDARRSFTFDRTAASVPVVGEYR